MELPAFYLVLLLFSPVTTFICHIFLQRCVRLKLPPLAVALLGLLAGFVLTLSIVWFAFVRELEMGKAPALIYACLVYGGLSFCYFQLFGMTETARRIHILKDLALNGPASYEDFKHRYGPSDMLSVRLERLLEWGQLIREGERYRLKSRTLYRIALLIRAWAVLLGFKKKFS